MAEESFPIVDQPMSAEQWTAVTRGIGSGIITDDVMQYSLGERNNAANTVTIRAGTRTAQAIVSGFYHTMDADVTLPIPAVTQRTVYYIGLTYDPLAVTPVTLAASTSKPSGQGKVHLGLFEITRSPDQLLTDAAVADRRVYISPSISVQNESALPTDTLLTTRAVALNTGAEYRRKPDGSWNLQTPHYVGGAYENTWKLEFMSGPGWLVTPVADGTRIVSADIKLSRIGGSAAVGTAWQMHGTMIPKSLRVPASGMNNRWFSANLAGHAAVLRFDLSAGQVWGQASKTINVANSDSYLAHVSWRI